MQSLPDIPPVRRLASAQDYLARAGKDLPEADRAAIVVQLIRLLDDSRFARLFAPGSRAEVPLVGRLATAGEDLLISGQIDRLVVTATEVLIADYKTNRPAPRGLSEVPKAYIRQLALYRAVLAKLYPGKPVRAALVWTEVPDLMEVSEEALDHALALVTSARERLDGSGWRS